jgi:glycine/sarcosine/betaine reductase complex component C subunit beta
VSARASIRGATFVLEHVPDLVRYGSKPSRERNRLPELVGALRTFEQAVSYPPTQVFIGNTRPEKLWELQRPWWRSTTPGQPTGPFGELIKQNQFYELLAELDQFDLVRLNDEPNSETGDIPLFDGEHIIGAIGRAHDTDEALSARVLLENLACKASAVHALRFLIRSTDVDPLSIDYVLGSGEEGIGDRYQRGGGSLAKAVAEACGLLNASGSDVKAFCAGPLHALILAGALVESGTYQQVAVLAGGSLAKLGMKFVPALDKGVPMLEDVLAGMAILVGPKRDGEPVIRMDAVGRHRVGSGNSQQALLEDIVGRPLDQLGWRMYDVDRFATELHNPEITEPAGGGDVPSRNYRMLGGLASLRGEIAKEQLDRFGCDRGLPGFSPTQGHIASAVPWLPHALSRFRTGEIHSTMLLAKGSLFLGRMTRLWDGASIILEA